MEKGFLKRRRVPRRIYLRRVGMLVRGEYQIVQGLEIGEGGILLEATVNLEVGQKTVLAFQIPGRADLVLLGTLRYELAPRAPGHPKRFGIQFDSVDFEDKRHIRNYVAEKTEFERFANG